MRTAGFESGRRCWWGIGALTRLGRSGVSTLRLAPLAQCGVPLDQLGGSTGSGLDERGYVALTFDYAHYGQSDGEPRQYEDPDEKLADLKAVAAVSEVEPGEQLSQVAHDRLQSGRSMPSPSSSRRWPKAKV